MDARCQTPECGSLRIHLWSRVGPEMSAKDAQRLYMFDFRPIDAWCCEAYQLHEHALPYARSHRRNVASRPTLLVHLGDVRYKLLRNNQYQP